MQRKAFTLIELLVVIAIIAILAAILFPVFAQAKAAAKKTAALSNVKQSSLAVIMYAGDADDNLPMGGGIDWFYPTDGGWSYDTQPYIKSYPLLLDPSDPKDKSFWQTWFDPTATVPISFASNGYINGDQQVGLMNLLSGKDVDGTRTRLEPTGWQNGWASGASIVSSTSMSRPAETIMLASRYGGNNMYGGGDVLSGIEDWSYTAPQAIPDGTRNGQPYTVTVNGKTVTVNKDNRYGAVAVYGNQGLFAFADGHAKAMNPTATNPSPQYTISLDDKNMWDSQRP